MWQPRCLSHFLGAPRREGPGLISTHPSFLSRRSKHTVVAYKDAIYVFGGDNG